MRSASLIDFTSIDAVTEISVKHFVAQASRVAAREKLRVEVLNKGSDEEIIAAAASECAPNTPITLADRYVSVPRDFELWPGFSCSWRPVVMRGSKHGLYWIYGAREPGRRSENVFAENLAERWLRFSKRTIVDTDHLRALADVLHKRIDRSHAIDCRARILERQIKILSVGKDRSGNRSILMSGRLIELSQSASDNVVRLAKIVQKTDDLERRARLALRTSRFRKAA